MSEYKDRLKTAQAAGEGIVLGVVVAVYLVCMVFAASDCFNDGRRTRQNVEAAPWRSE